MKIALIACVSEKKPYACPAKELYCSPWFKGAYAYAKSQNVDNIFILSAEHGLVMEDEVLVPYENTLNDKKDAERKQWADRVFAQLCEKTDVENDEYLVLAGNNYRKYLVTRLNHYEVPLCGLRFREQLSFFKKQNERR